MVYRINYSGDDAAGLAVANAYRNDIAVINQGIRNANDGLSSLQIKDGALGNISTLLDRLATLATQAASGETTNASRATINTEFQDVLAEIDREANVAGLTRTAAFSVFVSNRRRERQDRGHDRPGQPRPHSALTATCRDVAGGCGDGGCSADFGGHDARHRTGARSARSRTVCSSRSVWRSRRS